MLLTSFLSNEAIRDVDTHEEQLVGDAVLLPCVGGVDRNAAIVEAQLELLAILPFERDNLTFERSVDNLPLIHVHEATISSGEPATCSQHGDASALNEESGDRPDENSEVLKSGQSPPCCQAADGGLTLGDANSSWSTGTTRVSSAAVQRSSVTIAQTSASK